MDQRTKNERLRLIVSRHNARLLRQSQLHRKRRAVVCDEPDTVDEIEVSSVEIDDAVTIRGITRLAGPRIDD